MYHLKLNHHFDSAHLLTNYNGACSNLHGHRWNIKVDIFTSLLINDMIIDFKVLKGIINKLDHVTILQDCEENKDILDSLTIANKNKVVVPFNPTAENLVKYLYELIYQYLEAEYLAEGESNIDFDVIVELFESPDASVIYSE